MKIFISSVIQGFEEFREAARGAVEKVGHDVEMAEDFEASGHSPRSVCLSRVRGSDALILLAGTKYGSRTEAGISATEEEYWEARLAGKPLLVFVQDVPREEREEALQDFLSRIGRWESGHYRARFSTADELASEVENALAQDLRSVVDSDFPIEPEGVYNLLTALRALSKAHSEPGSFSLPSLGTLPRPEQERLLRAVQENQSVILKGDAGVGKTGIVNMLVDKLANDGAPVLFFRASAFPVTSPSVSVVSDILLVSTSLPRLIQIVSQLFGKCYIVVDQLDSVGGSPWSTALCAFLKEMATLSNVYVLVSSRIYDAETWPEIRDLGFTDFTLKTLEPEIAAGLLLALGVENPQSDLVEIATVLLNLSLIADLVTRGEAVSDVHTETALWHRYRNSLQNREGAEALARAVSLAKDVERSGTTDFAIDIAPDAATQKLLSRNVLVRASGERYRFFHEEVASYLYAWDASLRNRLMPDTVCRGVSQRQVGPVLRWVQRMYHEEMGEAEAEFVSTLLGAEDASFFVRVSALDVLKNQVDPRPDVSDALAGFLQTESYAQYFFHELTNPEWVQPLADRGIFKQFPDLIFNSNGSVAAVPWLPGQYIVRVAEHHPEFVVELAGEANTENWWVHINLLDAAMRIPPDNASQVAPYVANWLKECTYGTMFLEHNVIDFVIHLAESKQPDAVVTVIGALLELVERPVPDSFKDNP